MATHTVVALFDDYQQATNAIRDLEAAGIPSTDINLIANNAGNRYGDYPQYGVDRTDRTDTGSSAGTGAGIGALVGGAVGLLTGIGALAIPGVGPVVAAGALAATLAGAGVGAAVGGLVGALVEAGIPREHADIYAEAVRRGGTLIILRAQETWRDRASAILNRHSPVDIQDRAESWRQEGWRGFDDRAEPYASVPPTPAMPLPPAGTIAGQAPRAGIVPETGPALSSDPIGRPTDEKPDWQTGEPVTAEELQRDWEVRRETEGARVAGDAQRRTGVRIYPSAEGTAADKR